MKDDYTYLSDNNNETFPINMSLVLLFKACSYKNIPLTLMVFVIVITERVKHNNNL